MAKTKLSKPGWRSTVKLEFRSIRIGTLKTFPIHKSVLVRNKKEVKTSEPVVLSEKGVKFTMQLEKDGSARGTVIKIPASRILCIEAYVQRGCPVLWLTPDSVCAEMIRRRCSITNRNGPYLDPDSEAAAECQIAILPSHDPLPYGIGLSIQHIFHKIALKNGVAKGSFFTLISQKENHDKLVEYCVYTENVGNRLGRVTTRLSLVSNLRTRSITFHKKSGSNKRAKVSETSDDYSDDEQEEVKVFADDGNDKLTDKIQSLEARIDELQKKQECKICMDLVANVVFVPCGHLCSCTKCASVLGKCPLCRAQIEKAIRTHTS